MNLLSNGIDAHADRQINSNVYQLQVSPADLYIGLSKAQSPTPLKNKIVLIKTKIKSEKINIKAIDNGSGIREEIIPNIFEPFYTTKEEHGCGIGLSSTKHIVEKYFNGTISVKSRLGKGTAFEVEFPIKHHTPQLPHTHEPYIHPTCTAPNCTPSKSMIGF
jgi:signal transduction histidine kinase